MSSSTSSSSSSSSENETESSASSSEFSDTEYEFASVKRTETNEYRYQTPKKRKYRRSLHYGLSKKRANYHKVTHEKLAHFSEHREKNVRGRSSSPAINYDSSSSTSSMSQSPVSSQSTDDEFSSASFDYSGSNASPFSEFMESDSQTMNVHFLRHYVQFTRMYGPLYSYSCFGFESMNSYLKSMVHGTGNVNSQVCFAVGMSKQITSLVRDISDVADREIEQLTEQLSSKIIGTDIQDLHQEEDICLGKTTKMQPTHEYFSLLSEDLQAYGPSAFMRLQHKNAIFYCKEYQQAKTKNSYTVLFTGLDGEDQIGLVQCYILSNKKTYAVIKVCHRDKFSLRDEVKDSITNDVLRQFVDKPLCNHVWKIVPDDHMDTILVPTSKIESKCVYMEKFVSCPPNLVEHG